MASTKKLWGSLVLIAAITAGGAFLLVQTSQTQPSTKNQESSSTPATAQVIDQGQPIQIVPKKEQTAPAVATAAPKPVVNSMPQEVTLAAPATINQRSIVGILCSLQLPDGSTQQVQGSGVIIDPSGKILTARHLVDPKFFLTASSSAAEISTANATQFLGCDVGQMDQYATLPSASLIRSAHPNIQIPFLAYTAELSYLPGNYGTTKSGAVPFDFAVLKINGLTPAAGTFGIRELPASFDYSSLLTNEYPPIGSEVLTYGFPKDLSEVKGGSANTMYLVGSVGMVTDIVNGLSLTTKLESADGQVGSPLFYKGYVAGIMTAHDSFNARNTYSVSSNVIYEITYNH